MSGTLTDDVTRCAACDHELKSSALFCTSCGVKRGVGGASTGPDDRVCGACGAGLKPGAEFCTSCGVADTGEPAADRDPSDPPAEKETDQEAAVSRYGNISPARSREILSSVGGGMGSYVGRVGGPVTTRSGEVAPPRPPTDQVPADRSGPGRRPAVIAAVVAAAVLVVVVGLAVLFMGGSGGDGSDQATGADRPATSRPSGQGAGSKATTTSVASTTTIDEAKKKAAEAKKKADEAKKKADEKNKADEARQRAEEEQRRAAEAAAAATTQPPAQPQPQLPPPPADGGGRAPNTVARPGSGAQAVLSVDRASVGVPGAVTLTNVGNARLTWTATLSWGGTQPAVSPRSGALEPGQSVVVRISWPGGQSGSGSGRLDIRSPEGGSKSISVRG